MGTEEVHDTELVRAAQVGNKEAFAALVVRHRPLVHALCVRTLDDPVLAEDAVQEALLLALLNLNHLRRADRFGAWLAGIGLNVCRRLLRARTADTWSWDSLLGGRVLTEPIDEEPGPETVAEAADLRDRVQRAVAGLPAGQRAAVILFYLAGMTHAETAALLGVEIGAVKSRLHKARQALRRELWTTWHDEAPGAGGQPMVEMRVSDVMRRRLDGTQEWRYVVLLEEIGGGRRLLIWMGEFEATAVALHLERVPFPRPFTYAFATAMLEAAGGRVREVRIERLVDETFYAAVVIEGQAGPQTVDARPSDALNIALLAGAPIRVNPDVLATTAEGGAHGAWDATVQEGEGASAIAAKVTAQWTTYSSTSEE